MKKILLLIILFCFSTLLLAQPALTSANYQEKTGILTLKFDRVVQDTNVVRAGIQIVDVNDNSTFRLNEHCEVLQLGYADSINILLYTAADFSLKDAIKAVYNESSEVKITLDEGTVLDESYTPNQEIIVENAVDVNFITNSSPFAVDSVSFDANTGLIDIVLNEVPVTIGLQHAQITITSSQGTEIALNATKDQIEVVDSTIRVLPYFGNIVKLHEDEFLESTIKIEAFSIRDYLYNPVVLFESNMPYYTTDVELYPTEVDYDEDRNWLWIKFNQNLQVRDDFDNLVFDPFRISLISDLDTVKFAIVDLTKVRLSGSNLRIVLDGYDQERVETLLNNISFKLELSRGTVFTRNTYVPNLFSDTLVVEYLPQEIDETFIIDSVNTYYSTKNNFLNVAFNYTDDEDYNTVLSNENQNAVYNPTKIVITSSDSVFTIPGNLIPEDSISAGQIRIPLDEAYTNELAAEDILNLVISFEPFAFTNQNTDGSHAASFTLNIEVDEEAPQFTAVFYETLSNELFLEFDKAIENPAAVTGITFAGQAINVTESANINLSANQRLLRATLPEGFTVAADNIDPVVSIDENIFMSVMGINNEALNDQIPGYDDVKIGKGRYLWVRDRHFFERATYQKMCLFRDTDGNANYYVDIDDWNDRVTQLSLDTLKYYFTEETPKAKDASLTDGIFDAAQHLFGDVSIENADEKLVVLLTNITDNNAVGGNNTSDKLYWPGYYDVNNSPGNTDVATSNRLDMIYLDTYPQNWMFEKTSEVDSVVYDSIVAHGTNSAIQGAADIFARMIVQKNMPNESPWAVDGLAGLSQLLLTGDYSVYTEEVIGPKAVNYISPLDGTFNGRGRDNAIASFTFYLYLYENLYPQNNKQFIDEYLADITNSSEQKLKNLTGNLDLWLSIYSYAQAMNEDSQMQIEGNNYNLGLDNIESYVPLNLTSLTTFLNVDGDGIGDVLETRLVRPYYISLYSVYYRHADSVATTGDLYINGSADDTLFTMLSMGQHISVIELGPVGLDYQEGLDDSLIAIKNVPLDVQKNGTLDGSYDYNGNSYRLGEEFNFSILSFASSVDNNVTISTDHTTPAVAEVYLKPNSVNNKYLNINVLSTEELYYDTRTLPEVQVMSETDTNSIEITQGVSSSDTVMAVYQYYGSWEFIESGNYRIRVEANDLSGNNIEFTDKEIALAKLSEIKNSTLVLNENSIEIDFKVENKSTNNYVFAELISSESKFIVKNELENGTGKTVKIDKSSDEISFEELTVSFSIDENQTGLGIYEYTDNEWTEIPSRVVPGEKVYANLTKGGIYQLGDSNGDLVELVPTRFELHNNYPNPFNPTTNIKYAIAEQVHVNVVVYNIMGQSIKTLVNSVQTPATYSLQWNGKNDHGQKVASGIYFLTLKAGDVLKTRKMILLK